MKQQATWVAALVGALLLGAAATGRADTLAEVEAKGHVLVCAFDDRLPYSTSMGETPGFQLELAQAIARELGVGIEVRWVQYRFHARRAGCDMQMGTVSRRGRDDDDDDDDEEVSANRLRSVAGQRIFNYRHRQRPVSTEPYFRSRVHLVTRTGSGLVEAADYPALEGRAVAALHGSWAHMLLDRRGGITPRTRYGTELEMLAALDAGEIEAAVVTSTYLGWYRKGRPESKIEVAPDFVVDPQLDFDVAVSLRRTDDALVERMNEAIARLLADGTVRGLYEKYGIAWEAPRPAAG